MRRTQALFCLSFGLSLGLSLAVFLFSRGALAQASLQDVKISAATDLVHPAALDNADFNRLTLRDAEVMIYAPVDHLFDGQITFVGENKDGLMKFDVHEAILSSTKLLPRTRMRVGKFFLGVGRLNQFHRHDWPFVTAPKVQREFFQPGADAYEAESAADTGGEVSVLLPLPFYLDVTLGATNGYCFGHCDTAGSRPPRPLVYLHPTTFIDFVSGAGLLLGASYVDYKDAKGRRMALTGIDATYKHREGKTLRMLIQSEAWHRSQDFDEAPSLSSAGGYVYSQYGVNENWSAGLRLDGYSELNKSFDNGRKQSNFDYALAPVITYKASEFSTLRLAYTHEVGTQEGEGNRLDRRFEFQLVYLLGAHPAHDF